jgi:hypothetical protein
MSDHNPYRDDVDWSREKIRKANDAAATEDRRWEGAQDTAIGCIPAKMSCESKPRDPSRLGYA